MEEVDVVKGRGDFDEYATDWPDSPVVPLDTIAAGQLNRSSDGRLMVNLTVMDPNWTHQRLFAACAYCRQLVPTERIIERRAPHHVDTSGQWPCPDCGRPATVPETYTLYDEADGREYRVRKSARTTARPTPETADKFKRLADVVRAHEQGEATDREVVEAAMQVAPAVSKRIKSLRSWRDGDWQKTAGVIIAALMVPPAYFGAYVAVRAEPAAPLPPLPAKPTATEPAAKDPDYIQISVPAFLDLLDQAAAASEVSPPGGDTAPAAPPTAPTPPTVP